MPTLSKEVQEAFRTLPSRYLGAEPGFDATYHVRLGDVGHTWEIRCTTHGARVRMGATKRRPDVDDRHRRRTWCRLRQGELSGIEAFSQRRSTPAASWTSHSASRGCSGCRTAARRCCASATCRSGA